MNIIYKKGDLLKSDMKCIVHSCNGQHKMGRGIANQIRIQFPWAYKTYMNEPDLRLGKVIWAIDTRLPLIIGNMIGQEYWQADKAINGRNVDYDAIRNCLKEVCKLISLIRSREFSIETIDDIKEVGMPMIGAGLGGGDWTEIAKIIEEESLNIFQPVVYYL